MNPSHPPSIRGRQDAVDRPFIRSAMLAVGFTPCCRRRRLLRAGRARPMFTLRDRLERHLLDLQPTNPAVTAVFAGAPWLSVCDLRQPRGASVDFDEDPNEPVWNRARWLVHVPTNRVESSKQPFCPVGQRAYLVQPISNARYRVVTGWFS
ncbi:MAG: hypothetical protein U1G07_16480 [Verrucomicrobiota bacterium]